MDRPRQLATVAVFSALIVGSDFALAGIPNVKLMDTLVFVSAYLFGLETGVSVALLSEFVWTFASPWGSPGLIAPFLVFGEIIYAFGGAFASKVWRNQQQIRSQGIFMGGLLTVCAFAWDLETNVATAFIAFWPNLTQANVLSTIIFGVPFMLPHEISDFVFGGVVAPIVILALPRLVRWTDSIGMLPIRADEGD